MKILNNAQFQIVLCNTCGSKLEINTQKDIIEETKIHKILGIPICEERCYFIKCPVCNKKSTYSRV